MSLGAGIDLHCTYAIYSDTPCTCVGPASSQTVGLLLLWDKHQASFLIVYCWSMALCPIRQKAKLQHRQEVVKVRKAKRRRISVPGKAAIYMSDQCCIGKTNTFQQCSIHGCCSEAHRFGMFCDSAILPCHIVLITWQFCSQFILTRVI